MKKVCLFNNSSLSFRVHRKVIFDKLISLGLDVSIILPEITDLDTDFYAQNKDRIYVLPLGRKGINPLKELYSLLQLCKIIKKINPDLIHNFTIKCVLYGSIAARVCSVPKIVNTITGLGYVFTKNNLKTTLLKLVVVPLYFIVFSIKNVVLIFQNADDRKLLTDLVPLKANAELVYGSGVDIHFFKAESRVEKNILTITCVSRLLIEKGIETLVQALQILNTEKNLPSFQCWIIGDTDKGNPGSYSPQTVAKWSEIPNLKLWGFQKNIKSLLQDSDIFCLPSEREGLPMAILEAESMQLPILTTSTPGCKDTVLDSENGFLFEFGNAQQLAQQIKILLLDTQLRNKFGKKSREIVQTKFSKEIVTERIIKIYNI